MKKRLAKKRISRSFALVYSVPLTLNHAKPSFWTIDLTAQRAALRRQLYKLGLRRHRAAWAAKQWSKSVRRPPV